MIYSYPYVRAMRQLNDITEMFFQDSGRDIIVYFLANAGTWRGDTAKRIKAELKTQLAETK